MKSFIDILNNQIKEHEHYLTVAKQFRAVLEIYDTQIRDRLTAVIRPHLEELKQYIIPELNAVHVPAATKYIRELADAEQEILTYLLPLFDVTDEPEKWRSTLRNYLHNHLDCIVSELVMSLV